MPCFVSSRPRQQEAGYILIAVLFLVALVLVGLAVAAPQIATSIRRDHEEELVHRGLQYARAIRLYYRKFGRYPASLEQLEKTNEIRFLRRRYKDPITGKDEWRLIRFGQAKVRSTGLFGQPLGTAGQTGGAQDTSSAMYVAPPPTDGSTGTDPNTIGASGAPGTTSMPAFGGSRSNAAGGGLSGGLGGGPNGGLGSSSTPGSTSGSPGLGASTDSSQTFGGGGIVGVSSTSARASIREYHKQKHYNEWEFVYDPAQDRGGVAGQTGVGVQQQPGSQQNQSPFGSLPGAGSPTPSQSPPPQTPASTP